MTKEPSTQIMHQGISIHNVNACNDQVSERKLCGHFKADFYLADYYRTLGCELSEPAFIDIVEYRFGIDDESAHYHLPLKCTAWGCSLFRGG